MGLGSQLCFFSVLSNQQVPQEDITSAVSTNMKITVAALLELLIDFPMIFPENPELLMEPSSNPHLLVEAGQLQLASWKLSGLGSLQQEFQRRLSNCVLEDGLVAPALHIRVHAIHT